MAIFTWLQRCPCLVLVTVTLFTVIFDPKIVFDAVLYKHCLAVVCCVLDLGFSTVCGHDISIHVFVSCQEFTTGSKSWLQAGQPRNIHYMYISFSLYHRVVKHTARGPKTAHLVVQSDRLMNIGNKKIYAKHLIFALALASASTLLSLHLMLIELWLAFVLK